MPPTMLALDIPLTRIECYCCVRRQSEIVWMIGINAPQQSINHSLQLLIAGCRCLAYR